MDSFWLDPQHPHWSIYQITRESGKVEWVQDHQKGYWDAHEPRYVFMRLHQHLDRAGRVNAIAQLEWEKMLFPSRVKKIKDRISEVRENWKKDHHQYCPTDSEWMFLYMDREKMFSDSPIPSYFTDDIRKDLDELSDWLLLEKVGIIRAEVDDMKNSIEKDGTRLREMVVVREKERRARRNGAPGGRHSDPIMHLLTLRAPTHNHNFGGNGHSSASVSK